MLYVEKTIPEDCFRLAPNLKQLDKYELAAVGSDPLSALIDPFRYNRPNTIQLTVFDENHDVVALWGAMPISKTQPRKAAIWFLSCELLDKHKRYFLQRNHKWLRYLESHYDYVFNFITKEHKQSIRWLKWQNFTFSDNTTLANGVEMYYFYKYLPKVDVDIQPIISEIGPKWTTELKDKGQL